MKQRNSYTFRWKGERSDPCGYLFNLTLILFLIAGEIRCYCNEAGCVSTGYMCKSAMGKCYSQLTYERDNTRSVHGCVESLPQADKMVCSGQGDIGESMRH